MKNNVDYEQAWRILKQCIKNGEYIVCEGSDIIYSGDLYTFMEELEFDCQY